MTRNNVAVIFALAVGTASFAEAQPTSLQGYVTYGNTTFSAAESFEAVRGSRHIAGVGFGGMLGDLWRNLVVDVGFAQRTLEGQRVLEFAGQVYSLDVPLTVRTRALDVVAGWRFLESRTFSPYVGAGASFVSYRETAPFAQTGDDVNDSATGAVMLGGVNVPIVHWLEVGGEFRYRTVTGIVGSGGVSETFDENDIGGLTAAVRISIGR